MMQAISGRLIRPRSRSGSAAAGAAFASPRANQISSARNIAEHQHGDDRRLVGEVRGGPEEIDAAQEADEQRRIAERRQRAADIGDQEDEENDDVDVVRARGIGADQRPDQDHGGAGGADDARHRGAEQQDAGIDQRRRRAGCR